MIIKEPSIIKYVWNISIIKVPSIIKYLWIISITKVPSIIKYLRNILTTKRLGVGKAFGELAILYNCKRTASVKAIEVCHSLYLCLLCHLIFVIEFNIIFSLSLPSMSSYLYHWILRFHYYFLLTTNYTYFILLKYWSIDNHNS